MLALIEPGNEEKKPQIITETCLIGKLPCIKASISVPVKLRRKHLDAFFDSAAEKLRKLGVLSILCRDDFTYGETIYKNGFIKPDESFLLKATAGKIAVKAADEKERIFISIDTLRQNERLLILSACENFRYIVVSAQEYLWDGINDLSRRFGAVPERFCGGSVQCDTAVIFKSPLKKVLLPTECPVLTAHGKAENIFGGREINRILFNVKGDTGKFPKGYDGAVLLSVIIECGIISQEDVSVEKISIF